MSLLLTGLAATSFVINGPAVGPAFGTARANFVAMQMERVPGEGDPFNNGVMRRSEDDEAYQPRGTSDATVIKKQYIETDDEPWHSTCRSDFVGSKTLLTKSLSTALPFVAPESDLEKALEKCSSEKEVDAAVAACIAAGGRKGSPATENAKKYVQSMAKAAKDGKKAPAYKSKAEKIGGDKPGFGLQGEGRAIAKVHDNSV